MRNAAIVIGLAGVLLAGGCGKGAPTYESLTQDSIQLFKDMTGVLAGITDEATAKAAKPKLDALAGQMQTMKEAMQKIGEPPKEVEEQLKKKYEGQLKEVMGKFMEQAMRISSNPAIGKVLEETMQKLKG